jgi:dTMP kinase
MEPKNYLLRMDDHGLPGRLIVFDGVDGAGKSTLLQHAKAHLQSRGIAVHQTRMPSDRIRTMKEFRTFHDSHDEEKRKAVSPFAITVLVHGDRLIVHETDVLPALRKGLWVLCDRYAFTSVVICDDPIIRSIVERFVRPDIVFLANASPEVVEQRVKGRPDEKALFYDREVARQRVATYRGLARDNGFTVVDTEAPLASMLAGVSSTLDHLVSSWSPRFA